MVALAPMASADQERDKIDRLIDRLESNEPETPKDIIRDLRPQTVDETFDCFKHIEAQRRQIDETPSALLGEEGRFIRECLKDRPMS